MPGKDERSTYGGDRLVLTESDLGRGVLPLPFRSIVRARGTIRGHLSAAKQRAGWPMDVSV